MKGWPTQRSASSSSGCPKPAAIHGQSGRTGSVPARSGIEKAAHFQGIVGRGGVGINPGQVSITSEELRAAFGVASGELENLEPLVAARRDLAEAKRRIFVPSALYD